MILGDRGFVSSRSLLAGWPNFVMLVVDDLNLTTKKKKNVMGMGFVKHIVGLLSSKTMGLENFEHIQELCLLYFIFIFFAWGSNTWKVGMERVSALWLASWIWVLLNIASGNRGSWCLFPLKEGSLATNYQTRSESKDWGQWSLSWISYQQHSSL